MANTLRLGIAGLGTVGTGLVRLIETHNEKLQVATGRSIEITSVCARDRAKNRGIDIGRAHWFTDATEMAQSDTCDVFVELIGGEEGVARASVTAALRARKPVVTANKALLAKHGIELAALAEEQGVPLAFEAAVAGGIPIIKALREALVGNAINRIYGILNGTCNYILTQMQEAGLPFEDVLRDAQQLGYAEADPTFDIGGHDTAHKLALLTSVAFGTEVAFDQIHLEGIEKITPADIDAADELGYRIKLLGVALRTESGIEQRVHPTMVAKHSAIAEVSGVTNCVAIDGDFVGNLLLIGPGAGAEATASAVMGDIGDVARGASGAPFVTPARGLSPYQRARLGHHQGSYYVRLSVYDRPGAMASIAQRMADQDVSLESIVQRRPKHQLPGTGVRPELGSPTSVVLITHETTEAAIRAALEAIEKDGKIAHAPQMIRIEQLG
ncbi:MAG: homoserine dehydrogenase [Hyphomicrobiaceae bacterium]